MSILGNVYGQWTIIEELHAKPGRKKMVIAQCSCGTIKEMQRSPFMGGSNSEKCFKCHLKNQKVFPISSSSKRFT